MLVIGIFLICFLFSLLFTIFALNSVIITRKKFRHYIEELNRKSSKFFEQSQSLTLQNRETSKLLAALKRRHKIQDEWIAELQSRKNEQLCKIEEISKLTSRSLIDSGKILNEVETSRLLGEISKSADNLSGEIIVRDNSNSVLLYEALKEINQFLEWNLLKSKISLKISVDENITYNCDGFALKVLLLNIVVQKVSKAFEGAEITIHIKNLDQLLEIECCCFNVLETSGKLTADLKSIPLILSESNIQRLSRKLHCDLSGLGSKITILKTLPHKKDLEMRVANVIQMF